MSTASTAGDTRSAVPDRYLELGLRLGRHVPGLIDCWFGDPALAAAVAAERPVDPRELAGDARRLRAELPDTGLPEDRRRFLHGQLTALECTARRLNGEEMPFREEVERYFGIEVAEGSTDQYAALHEDISEVVGGTGPLYARVGAFYDRNSVSPDTLLRCVQAVSEQVRARVVPMFGLADQEQVVYRVVRNVPWNAFNRYLGGFRSEVALNSESGRTVAALPVIITHESYAGHHTEHCLKEAGLVRERRQREQTIALVNTPQCLMAEGTAELSLDIVLGAGWGEWTAGILATVGVHVEGAAVERMLGLVQQLMPVRQDALLMAHDRRVDPADVVEHLLRWLLLPRDRAEQMVTFLLDPLWRAYSVTYVEGARLVRAWLEAPGEQTPAQRYAKLLREPMLPADLRADHPRSTHAGPGGRADDR